MEKGISLVSRAKDFIRDLLVKTEFPSDGELNWTSAFLQGENRVELNLSLRLEDDQLIRFKAICYFCPSGLCMVQLFSTKEKQLYHATALFRDKEGFRHIEFQGPRGNFRQGFYPIMAISS